MVLFLAMLLREIKIYFVGADDQLSIRPTKLVRPEPLTYSDMPNRMTVKLTQKRTSFFSGFILFPNPLKLLECFISCLYDNNFCLSKAIVWQRGLVDRWQHKKTAIHNNYASPLLLGEKLKY